MKTIASLNTDNLQPNCTVTTVNHKQSYTKTPLTKL